MASPDNLNRLLFGDGQSTRFTQDSAVLPDVWREYASRPGKRVDLILTPYDHPESSAAKLAKRLRDVTKLTSKHDYVHRDQRGASVVYNRSTVAARLFLDELIQVVLPMTKWWSNRIAPWYDYVYDQLTDESTLRYIAEGILGLESNVVIDDGVNKKTKESKPVQIGHDVLWMLRIVGIIFYEHAKLKKLKKPDLIEQRLEQLTWQPYDGSVSSRDASEEEIQEAIKTCSECILAAVKNLPSPKQIEEAGENDDRCFIHLVSLNRTVRPSVWRSRVAVKSDAAHAVFNISCSNLAWAIIDDGVDAGHPALQRQTKQRPVDPSAARSRVVASFDFTPIRQILSEDAHEFEEVAEGVQRLRQKAKFRKQLRKDLESGRELDWSIVRELVEIPHDESYQLETPRSDHGTHVAGILGGDLSYLEKQESQDLLTDVDLPWQSDNAEFQGVCPDISLYDFRVIDHRGRGDEFSVMAALQFIRHLNSTSRRMRIHGVNLSLSIMQDVANYACGRTPVCDECDRLVGDGVVVVAAAGNDGFSRPSRFNPLPTFRSASITDPGNTDSVITVGATHRTKPHTYGVSYFSSRGPTGDGRIKPDLVAPGEKIESCIPGGRFKRLDGTSMAAPHVSGAAALLMARHSELIGQPARLKQVLCDSATDLGREPYFQGHGMLDILRALQSV